MSETGVELELFIVPNKAKGIAKIVVEFLTIKREIRNAFGLEKIYIGSRLLKIIFIALMVNRMP